MLIHALIRRFFEFYRPGFFINGGGGAAAAYDIAKALRFRAAASAYLSRTFSATPYTYTLSCWVKRGALGAEQVIAGSRWVSGVSALLEFQANDTIRFVANGSAVCSTSAVFRDPAADYHIVLRVSPSGTAYIYVNGSQVASGATTSTPWLFNSAAGYVNTIGRIGDLSSLYLDGYLSDIHFIDGIALGPEHFGYSDAPTNSWKPKAYTGHYGTNGFYLPFSDGTNLTSLGYDKSGTNLFTYSEDFTNAAWSASNATVTANTDTAPDGTTSADTLTDTSNVSFGSVSSNSVSGTSGTAYCTSLYIKKDSTAKATRFPVLRLAAFGASAFVDLALDTSTGEHVKLAFGDPVTASDAGVVDAGAYWRVWITATFTDAGVTGAGISIIPAAGAGSNLASYDGTATGGIVAWGAQIEKASAIGLYHKTSGTAKQANNWTLSGHSLTAGPTYDWLDDTPTNNHATLNNLAPDAANISYANLRSGTTAVRSTMDTLAISGYWEVTAGGSNVTAGTVSEAGSTNTTTVTANKTFAFRLSASGSLDYRNVTDGGAWTSIATGLSGIRYAYGTGAAADWNFGQRPFSGTVPGGYFSVCTKNMAEGVITTSGTFTGNLSANGPCIVLNGVPLAMTINGNAVTFGTHADKLANGFKVRSSSASYNTSGTNTYSVTSTGAKFKYANAQGNP